MEELPRNIREFLVRDLVYIVGGSVVITSFLYRFDRLPDEHTPIAFYFLGVGIAYVVGNAVQDISSIFRLVTTASVRKLGPIGKWLYRRFYVKKWEDIQKFDADQAAHAVRVLRKKSRAYAAGYERVIAGLILAATMAPCTLIADLAIWSRWWVHRDKFDLCIGVVLIPMSVGLLALARVRAAWVTQVDARAPKDLAAFKESRPTSNKHRSKDRA